MDWSKAKNVLIVALVATNLFLIWAIFTSHKTVSIDNDLIEQTTSLLKNHGIDVYCEIPTKSKKIPVLSIFYDDIVGIFDYPTDNSTNHLTKVNSLTESAAIKIAKKFLSSKNLLTDTTEVFSVTAVNDNEFRVKFKNIIEGIELDGNYAVCTVTGSQVTKLERNWLSPSGFGKNKREIIPASTILLTFMTNFSEEKQISITDISLVYKLDSPYGRSAETSYDTAFPMWRITCSDGTKRYYNAYKF